jgi:lipopolysaccharide transport system ATP-binding protein
LRERRDRIGSGIVRFVAFSMTGDNGEPVNYARSGGPCNLALEYEAQAGFDKTADLLVNIVISNNKGQRLFGLPSDVVARTSAELGRRGRFVCRVPSLPLLPGTYELDIACLVNRELTDKVMGAASITVIDGDVFGTGRLPLNHYGDVVALYDWDLSGTGFMGSTVQAAALSKQQAV